MKTASKLITGFVLLIIGVVLLSSIAAVGLEKTTFTLVGSENVAIYPHDATTMSTTNVSTLANAPSGWQLEDGCAISGLTLSNGTELGTLTTDYTPDLSAGTITFVDTVWSQTLIGANNYTTASYSYCGDDYLQQSWQRTIVNIISGFFAISLMVIAVGIFYTVMKDEGLLNI